MSPRQKELIEQLIDEMNWDNDDVDDHADLLDLTVPWQEMSTRDASRLIEELIRTKGGGEIR